MKYWGGNYDTYQRTREEQDINQVFRCSASFSRVVVPCYRRCRWCCLFACCCSVVAAVASVFGVVSSPSPSLRCCCFYYRLVWLFIAIVVVAAVAGDGAVPSVIAVAVASAVFGFEEGWFSLTIEPPFEHKLIVLSSALSVDVSHPFRPPPSRRPCPNDATAGEAVQKAAGGDPAHQAVHRVLRYLLQPGPTGEVAPEAGAG